MRKLLPLRVSDRPLGGEIATELAGDVKIVKIGRLRGRRQPVRVLEYNYKIRCKNIM